MPPVFRYAFSSRLPRLSGSSFGAAQGIVRIAQLKYHGFPNLERRVHKLINDDILPKAKRVSTKSKVSLTEGGSRDVANSKSPSNSARRSDDCFDA